jgi:hypothetical protein
MSLRQWSAVKDRMRFTSLFSLTILAFEVSEIEGLLREQGDDDDDSITPSVDSTDSDSSMESLDDDLVPEMISMLVVQHISRNEPIAATRDAMA